MYRMFLRSISATTILAGLAFLAPSCAPDMTEHPADEITISQGEDCVAVVDRFQRALAEVSRPWEKEKVKGAVVYQTKSETHRQYLVVKWPSPVTADWAKMLHGDVSECNFRSYKFDVILSM